MLTDAPPAAADAATRGRILGVDIARALAILGMLAVHVGPTDAPGPLGRLYAAPYGRASLLFVVVAGVGVSLMARSASPLGARRKLLWRATLLLPAGLALQELDHGANVILQDYALFFILATLAIALSWRWLLGLAVAFAALGPVAYVMGRAAAPGTFDRSPTSLTDPLGDTVHGLVLSGPYPLITWAAPFLLGLWLGRLDLRSPRLRRQLMVIGGSVGLGAFLLARLLVATLGPPVTHHDPRFLMTSAAHGQMPLWLIGGTGVAAALLGAALIAGDRLPRLTRPFAAAGRLALTIYVGHLLILAAVPAWTTSDELLPAIAIVTVFGTAILTGATLWCKVASRGPLELALQPRWLERATRVPAPSAPSTAQPPPRAAPAAPPPG